MDLNRLTEKSQEALRQAHTIATRRSHQGVDVEHIFAALVPRANPKRDCTSSDETNAAVS